MSDLHADSVVYRLGEKGVRVVRVDPTVDHCLPANVHIETGTGTRAVYEFPSGETLSSADVAGVLCRFAIDGLTPSDANPLTYFSRSEELAAFLAPLRMLDSSLWINDPWVEVRADCRILQAHKAIAAGLSVPPFIVSSDYSKLLEFHAAHNHDCIIKPISNAALAKVSGEFVHAHELTTENFSAPYAVEFRPLPAGQPVRVDTTPSLLQQRVHKKFDIRATVVDNSVFSAAMRVRSGAPVDFRRDTSIRAEPFPLPPAIQASLVRLVASLGLRYASCDLTVDENEEIRFLESNVSGNWLWTELDAALPISEAIAAALIQPQGPPC
ncbi:ATP-grasp domain-containing protein [Paludibaculum fermentans]|uniref:ATP-grasp domain-containing protein n=1 Tax=Paludibaculum fermentans TaxID=1473598 RepID=UPI003EBDB982